MPVFSQRLILGGGGRADSPAEVLTWVDACPGAEGVCAMAGVANRANAETAVKNTFMVLAP